MRAGPEMTEGSVRAVASPPCSTAKEGCSTRIIEKHLNKQTLSHLCHTWLWDGQIDKI